MRGHVALLGDSILDNGAYTSGGPDVVTCLRRMLPPDWKASLLARDGSVIADLGFQVANLPSDVTNIVVSLGGNDVLETMTVLGQPARSLTDALLKLGERARAFERAYRTAIDQVSRLGRETTLCTIYNGNLDSPEASAASILADPEAARLGLRAFNDVILRVAFESRLRVIDLRLVCTEPADYANPIEPSSQGGEKIARAIVRSLGLTDRPVEHSQVFY